MAEGAEATAAPRGAAAWAGSRWTRSGKTARTSAAGADVPAEEDREADAVGPADRRVALRRSRLVPGHARTVRNPPCGGRHRSSREDEGSLVCSLALRAVRVDALDPGSQDGLGQASDRERTGAALPSPRARRTAPALNSSVNDPRGFRGIAFAGVDSGVAYNSSFEARFLRVDAVLRKNRPGRQRGGRGPIRGFTAGTLSGPGRPSPFLRALAAPRPRSSLACEPRPADERAGAGSRPPRRRWRA